MNAQHFSRGGKATDVTDLGWLLRHAGFVHEILLARKGENGGVLIALLSGDRPNVYRVEFGSYAVMTEFAQNKRRVWNSRNGILIRFLQPGDTMIRVYVDDHAYWQEWAFAHDYYPLFVPEYSNWLTINGGNGELTFRFQALKPGAEVGNIVLPPNSEIVENCSDLTKLNPHWLAGQFDLPVEALLDTPKKFSAVNFVIDFEGGELTTEEVIAGFSQLYKSGVLFSLQGAYHRTFNALVETGHLTAQGDVV